MGGPSQATSTSSTEPPGYVQDAQKNLLSNGQSSLSNFLVNPNFSVAGFNPDQTQAFNYARDFANSAFDPSASQASIANPTTAKAGQIDPSETASLLNPFEQSVLDPTLKNMRQQYEKTNADIGARAAAAGAYGGSREAVQRSMLDKSFGDQVAKTTADLMSQGYSQAQAASLADAQMRGQTDQSNAAQTNAVGLANAASANGMKNSSITNQLAALQALLGTGQMQQTLSQSAVDAPMTALQKLASLVSSITAGAGSTTTKTEPVQDNTFGQILGGGLSLLKLLAA